MSIQFPRKPWQDGQIFKHTTSEGVEIFCQYDAEKNTWSFYRQGQGGSGEGGLVTTADVYTLNERPDGSTSPFMLSNDPASVVNQQEVNWWLYEHLGARSPIISDTAPTEHPDYEPPDNELKEGDFWIDNHDGRAFTPLYYWTGTKWEELEHDENWDEQLKEHTCAQFYKSVYDYNVVGAKEGHFCSWGDFGGGKIKYWTGPSGKDFYHNGDKIYIDDNGPFEIYDVVETGKWTTFFIDNGYKFDKTTSVVVKFSKIPKLCDTSFNDDRYVKKTGDTMTGALVMDNAGEIEMQNTHLDFMAVGESLKDANGDPILIDHNDGNGLVEQWDPVNERFSNIESVSPRLIRSDGSYGADAKQPFGIRVELDDGNTFKNQFKIGNRHGDAITVYGGGGPQVVFGDFVRNDSTAHGIDNGVIVKGIPTPDKELTPGDYAVNKEYVDAQDQFLQNEIIELEEELEAIIPSLERGVWKMTLSGTISGPGLITFYDDTFGNGNPTGLFTAAKSIWFHKNDDGGAPHGFDNVEAGNLLELFVQGSAEFGLYEVVEVHDQTGLANPYWAIDVSFVRTLENTSAADNGDLLRLKTFAAPSGGNASEFVLKTGDKMSGDLTMVKDPFNDGDVSPKIEFKSKRDDGTVFTNALSMPYDTGNTLKATGTFESGGAIYSGGAISASGNLQYNSSTRMYLGSTADTHYLGFGTSTNYQAIQWDKSNGLVQIRAKDSYGSNGQVLTKTSSGVEWASPGGMYFGRRYRYSSSTSGTPGVGYFQFYSGKLYINETDLDGNRIRHTAGDFTWDIPFYCFAADDNHVLMASMLGTRTDYTGSGYMRIYSNGWNSNSMTNGQIYYTHLTGLW